MEATTADEDWTLFSDRKAVAEFIKDVQLVDNEINDEKQSLKDPFDETVTLSTAKEKIILFDKTVNYKVVLTDKSIYCIFEPDKVERIDLLNVVSINTNNNDNDSVVSIKVYANYFTYPLYWKKSESIGNVYYFEFIISGANHSIRALYWEVIGTRCTIDSFEQFFMENVIHYNNKICEFYQYHTFVCKLSAHGIISDTLLLITNKCIYFIFLNCHKISHGICIKQVKWSFQISTLKSIIFDTLNIKNKQFMTILFHLGKTSQNIQRLSLESKTDDYRMLTSKSFKKFAFIDSKQQLKFNSILQTIYFDLVKSEKLISIHLQKPTDFNQNSISDVMLKIRKLNPSKTGKKWIRFVAINDNNINGFVEWSDNKESLSVDRLLVVGVSTDAQFLSEKLSHSKSDCYFALICEERVVAFISNNKQETMRWIKFITDSGIPKMSIQDYNFYLFINDELQI